MVRNLKNLKMTVGGTLLQAMHAINDNGAEVVFVVGEQDQVEGVITDGDIRRALLSGLGFDTPVSRIMNKNFISVGESVGRADALDVMRSRTIRQLPVVDKDRRLKGLHLLRELIGSPVLSNSALILAGGRGSRLGALTQDFPKPMLKVADRPILERIVMHLVGNGIRKIYISVNYKAGVIKDYFGDGQHHGCSIEYLEEEEPLGTGGPLGLLPPTMEEPILVMNGDLIVKFDVQSLLEFHNSGKYDLSLCARQHQIEIPFGVIQQKNGLLDSIEEKPTKNFLVSAGIYVVGPAVLDNLRSGAKIDMPDIITNLRGMGRPVGVYQLDEEWIDIGRKEDLNRAKGIL